MKIVDECFEEFEWDIEKNRKNLENRDIDFEDIKPILARPHFGKIDHRHEEKRIISIGKLNEITYVIVYTIRGDVCRIISARKASRDERKSYQTLYKRHTTWSNKF